MSQPAGTLLIAALFVAQISLSEPRIVAAQPQISGTWRGNSECVVKNSPCQDETNIYRFSEEAAKPGWFSGTGSKVVNGAEVSMGTLDWQYDAKTHILESKNPNGVFHFVVDGDQIEGTLLLSDGTIYRRIHLSKANDIRKN
jgi:hypothetical protein